MSGTVKEAVTLLEALPETEQDFALEFIKKLVLAWDPDYTRLTSDELSQLEESDQDTETISHNSINWN